MYANLRSINPFRLLSLVCGVITAIAAGLVYLKLPTFTLLALGSSIGFFGYSWIGETGSDRTSRLDFDYPSWLPSMLTTIFLLATAASIFSLSWAYYDKPLFYYAALAVAAGALVFRVVTTDLHKSNLLLAIFYGINTFASNQLAFPLGLYGPDFGSHVKFTKAIVMTGHVYDGSLYAGFPGQHILAGTVAIFAGFPVRPTYMVVGIMGMLLSLFIVYLIGHHLGDERYATMSVIIMASMDAVIYRAGHPSKLAYAIPLILLMLMTFAYMININDRTLSRGFLVLFILFGTLLAFTHHYSVIVSVVMVGAIVLGRKLYILIDGGSNWHTKRLVNLKTFLSIPAYDTLSLILIVSIASLNLLVLSGFSHLVTSSVLPRIHRVGSGIIAYALSVLPSLPGGTPNGIFTGGGTQTESKLPTTKTTAETIANKLTEAGGTPDGSGSEGGSATTQPTGTPKGDIPGGGSDVSGSLFAELTRFEQIPEAAAFVNTIGSGILISIAIIGVFWFLRRRSALSMGLLVWGGIAVVWMVSGLLLDIPFSLPQRLYAIFQITVLGFLAARGVLAISDNVDASRFAQPATAAVVVVVVGLVFFSASSIVAGMETSPYNDDIPHRTWYEMTEEQAARDLFQSAGISSEETTWARQLDASENLSIKYEEASGLIIAVNSFRLKTGIVASPGHGHVGTARWIIPKDVKRQPGNYSRFYDNGIITAHINET